MNQNIQNKCTISPCIITSEDKNTLQCSRCQRRFHFECTLLPPYMIQQILSSRKTKYKCCECTDVTDQRLKKIENDKPTVNPLTTDDDIWRHRVPCQKDWWRHMSRALSVPKRLMTPYVAYTFRAKKTDDDIWRMRILFQEYRRIKIRKIFSKSSFQNKIEKLQKRLLFILIMLIWVFFIVFWTFSRCNFLLQFFSCIDLYTSFLQSDIKNLYQIWIKEVQIIKKWKNINKNTLITMSFSMNYIFLLTTYFVSQSRTPKVLSAELFRHSVFLARLVKKPRYFTNHLRKMTRYFKNSQLKRPRYFRHGQIKRRGR